MAAFALAETEQPMTSVAGAVSLWSTMRMPTLVTASGEWAGVGYLIQSRRSGFSSALAP
jgi:hypothetical protein